MQVKCLAVFGSVCSGLSICKLISSASGSQPGVERGLSFWFGGAGWGWVPGEARTVLLL